MIQISLKSREDILICMARKGINSTSLSLTLGVSQSYLSQVLNGKRTPSAKLAKKIAEELDLNVNSIFDFQVTTKEVNT